MRVNIILAFLLSLISVAAQGQDCADYTQYTRWVTEAPFSGIAGGVAVAGEYAYVVNENSHPLGMRVYDISDPFNPVAMGSTPASGGKYDIAIDGNHAYVTSNAGFEVFDIQNPYTPFMVGSIGTPSSARGLDVRGKYAYVAADDFGLVIIDVSAPYGPTQVGLLPLPAHTRDVVVAGNLAYVANYDNLHVVDVSKPTDPVILGTAIMSGGYSTSLAISGDHIYLGGVSSGAGLHVADITDPTAPYFTGSVAGFESYDVALVANGAFICGSEGMTVVDISNPAEPNIETHVRVKGDFIAAAKGYAYLGGGSAVEPDLQVVELGVLGAPDPLGAYTMLDYVYLVETRREVAFALGTRGTNTWHLDAVDISDPALPKRINNLDFGHGVHHSALDVDEDLAVFRLDDEVHIVDVSALPEMQQLSSFTPGNTVHDLALEGSHLFLATTAGLRIYSVADPKTPVLVGGFDLYNPKGIDVDGPLAYLTGDGYGLQVIDVSDPGAPFARGAVNGNHSFSSITVDEDYAYLTGYYSFAVVYVSLPDFPALVTEVPLPGDPLNITKTGETVCVALLQNQVQLFDVSTPISPTVLGNTGGVWPSRAFDVAGDGGRIVVAAEGAGLTLFPAHCFLAGVDGEGGVRSSSSMSLSAWPNPFNPRATISFALDTPGPANLAVYDVAGRQVQELLVGELTAGSHVVTWNGRDAQGRGVGTGIYFCRLATERRVETRKLIFGN